MAEEAKKEAEAAAAAAGAESKKKGGLPPIVMIAGVAVICLAAGFFVSKMMGGKGKAATAVEGTENAAEVKKEGEAADTKKGEEVKKEGEHKAGEEKKGGEEHKTGEEKKGEGENKTGDEAKTANIGEEGSNGPGVLTLEEFTVNLNDPFGRRYAQVHLKLKLEKKDLVQRIQESELIMPQIRDEIFMIISSKTFSELSSIAGKIALKDEIMMRVNEILKKELTVEPVKDIYYEKFVMQ